MDDTGCVILGVVGSTAYGLDNPDSDIDRLGVWVRDTNDFLGLTPPGPENGKNTRVQHEPSDTVMHELGKFCGLALKCNPTITELLWLSEYEHLDPLVGEWLIEHRKAFLSQRGVRDSYLGYATAQFKRIQRRESNDFSSDLRNRTSKHARHLMRLIDHSVTLWTSGEVVVRVGNPEKYFAFGEAVEAGDVQMAIDYIAKAEEVFDTVVTALPPEPNRDLIEEFVITVRKRQLQLTAQRS